ncbi:hypothetical protein KEJ47_06565 [Candidatus Bathyarchaeota archaeon]|nr:hypothetical protein [Candidatus Bathyarchaeota archaeon]
MDNVIEGSYLETNEGLLFSVKGHFHPEDLIIAYLRYIPDERGERRRGEIRFKRLYEFNETYEILRRFYPQYINYVEKLGLELQSVPIDRVSKIYHPDEKLKEIMEAPKTDLEKTISRFVLYISSESRVPVSNFGVSGSVLINLASCSSDIDLVIYGSKASIKLYYTLKKIRRKDFWIKPYDEKTIEPIAKARWSKTNLNLDKLKKNEVNKVLHGLVEDREYFIRLVKFPAEIKKEISSKPLGRIKLRGVIKSAKESIFTPCTYKIKDCRVEGYGNLKISELLSFRGKFTEQVQEGEEVEAKGTMERVQYPNKTIYRVILGEEEDYLISLKYLETRS